MFIVFLYFVFLLCFLPFGQYSPVMSYVVLVIVCWLINLSKLKLKKVNIQHSAVLLSGYLETNKLYELEGITQT